jgi:hypothetical protein
MPALVTKTIRITQEQANELDLKYKGSSSFLFRELFDIWNRSLSGAQSFPTLEMQRLRQRIKAAKG